nr:hypothetical protein [Odoribacter sp. OF09-27XD]
MTHTYTVGLKDLVPPGDSADIVSFRLERYQPLDYKLSGNVEIDRTNGKVWIEVYGGDGGIAVDRLAGHKSVGCCGLADRIAG